MSPDKQLFVLRHAKSSWDDPGLDDHERPLAPRGRRAVRVVADHIRAAGIRPALVLSSSSRRTLETLEGISPGGELLIESELYSASADGLLERLRRVPPNIDSVMLIGHNPAVQILVVQLAGSNQPAHTPRRGRSQLSEVERKFPTGALATLAFQGPWSELAPGSAQLVEYVRPKDLG